MRKSGKTSLIREVERSLLAESVDSQRRSAFAYLDLEDLPSPIYDNPVPLLVPDLVEGIRVALSRAGFRTLEVGELKTTATLVDFRRALGRLLNRLNPGERLVLALDEIEHLCPPGAERHERTSGGAEVAQLFGALRRLVQENENFGLVISGLSSSSMEAGQLFQQPNPFFESATPRYLGPFEAPEAALLLRSIGRQAGLHWSDEACELATAMTGGNVALLRKLGSRVLRSVPRDRVDVVEITASTVLAAKSAWLSEAAPLLKEVIAHLRLFYEDELALLELMMNEPTSENSYAESFPEEMARLAKLGVVPLCQPPARQIALSIH
jgi:hypothetical protein